MVLIIVTLMLTVPTPLVASLVPVMKASLEMAPAAFVVSYRVCGYMQEWNFECKQVVILCFGLLSG